MTRVDISARPRRDLDARLIWRLFISRAIEAGITNKTTVEWEGLSPKLRDAFVGAVSIVMNDQYEALVRNVAKDLGVGVE